VLPGSNAGGPLFVYRGGLIIIPDAQQWPQKIRRYRHITDYVLAEEEKRLLIKEGHTDFPTTCQSLEAKLSP
jgi:hypothetical protein